MAKIRNYTLSAKRIAKTIDQIVNVDSKRIIENSIEELLNGAAEVAKNKITQNHEHTQQFGDKLADQIGVKIYRERRVSRGVLYVPVSKDPYIAQQMYYLENGAGLVSKADSKVRDGWFFYILDENKDEAENLKNIHILKVKDKDGNETSEYVRSGKDSQLVGYVKESKPVHYMQAARRYLTRNSNKKIADRLNTYFVRKTWKTKGQSK